jgi:hypothetical protein
MKLINIFYFFLYLLLLITGLITFFIDYNNYYHNKESNFTISKEYFSFLFNDVRKLVLNNKASLVYYTNNINKSYGSDDYESELLINSTKPTNKIFESLITERSSINKESLGTLNNSNYYFYIRDKLFIAIDNNIINSSLQGFDCSNTSQNGKCIPIL